MIRLSSTNDFREDLELAVIELRSLGVVPSSIRRYVNAAIRATEDGEGITVTPWLRKRWRREQEPFEDPSRPIGNAVSRPRMLPNRRDASDTPERGVA